MLVRFILNKIETSQTWWLRHLSGCLVNASLGRDSGVL